MASGEYPGPPPTVYPAHVAFPEPPPSYEEALHHPQPEDYYYWNSYASGMVVVPGYQNCRGHAAGRREACCNRGRNACSVCAPAAAPSSTRFESGCAETPLELLEIDSPEECKFFLPPIHIVPALLCCLLNLGLPGIGTIFAGQFTFCCSKRALFDTRQKQMRALKVCLVIGVLQLLLSPLIVGWAWSIIWGLALVGASMEHYHQLKSFCSSANGGMEDDGGPGRIIRPGSSGSTRSRGQRIIHRASRSLSAGLVRLANAGDARGQLPPTALAVAVIGDGQTADDNMLCAAADDTGRTASRQTSTRGRLPSVGLMVPGSTVLVGSGRTTPSSPHIQGSRTPSLRCSGTPQRSPCPVRAVLHEQASPAARPQRPLSSHATSTTIFVRASSDESSEPADEPTDAKYQPPPP